MSYFVTRDNPQSPKGRQTRRKSFVGLPRITGADSPPAAARQPLTSRLSPPRLLASSPDRAPQPPPPAHYQNVVTRDMRIDLAIDKISGPYKEQQTDFLMKKLDHTKARGNGVHVQPSAHALVNNVFPPPKIATPPKLRIRPGVSDEELRRIWHEDERKEQLAKDQESKPDMLEKMMDYHYPVPRPPPPIPSKKKVSELPRDVYPDNEPEGFKGLGLYSDPSKPKGRHCGIPPVPAQAKEAGRRHRGLPENEWVLGYGHRDQFEAKRQQILEEMPKGPIC